MEADDYWIPFYYSQFLVTSTDILWQSRSVEQVVKHVPEIFNFAEDIIWTAGIPNLIERSIYLED